MIDQDFIRLWDEALTRDIDTQLPDNVPPHLAEQRSVLREPASAEAISAAERCLGFELPPSYKQFLRHTNGAYANGLGMVFGSGWEVEGDLGRQGIGFLPIESLMGDPPAMAREWASEHLDGLVDPNYRVPDSEWEYLDYNRIQDPSFFKTGHYRHCVTITTNSDGWEVMLNPLVRQPDGEWEAWDFGSKYPGAYRYRSFKDLLQHQIDNPYDFTFAPVADVETAIWTLDSGGASHVDRQEAIHQLWLSGLDAHEHPRWRDEALRLALDRSADRFIRGNQARSLAWKLDLNEMRRLLAESEPLVWHPTVAPLVGSSEPGAREVIYNVLTSKPVEHMTVTDTLRDPTGVLWDAYQKTGNLYLLAASARCGHLEAQRRGLKIYVAGETDEGVSQDLRIAVSRTSPELADDVVEAAQTVDAPVEVLGPLLARIAPDRAVPVLKRVFDRADLQINVSETAHQLAEIGTADSMDALIGVLAKDLTYPAGVIGALGQFPHHKAVSAVAAQATSDNLVQDVIYALEQQRIEEARLELIKLDHIQAWRALGRLRDDRALDPLLNESRSYDGERRREGLEGLRELSDPRATARLIEVLHESEAETDDAAICAHGIVTMKAPDAEGLLSALLDESQNPHLMNVVTDWLNRLNP